MAAIFLFLFKLGSSITLISFLIGLLYIIWVM